MPQSRATVAPKDVNNRQVILLALLLQGGASQFIDIEDIAVAAYRLAPTRFRWNRYDYPSVEAARVAFKHWKDLKNEEPRFISDRLSYTLTALGVREAVQTSTALFGVRFESADEAIGHYRRTTGASNPRDAKQVVSNGTRTTARPSQSELRRVKAHKLYKLWQSGAEDFELWEIADLLNCLPDSSRRVWDDRFNRLNSMAAFWQDDDLGRFLGVLQKSALRRKE